jgi:multidrug efflux pump subunit AcrA (membrane-fusion protein)
MPATVSTDAVRDQTFSGSVLAIAPAVDAATNAGLVRVRIANAGRLLKVGIFAQARLVLAEHANVLVVPPSAVVKGDNDVAVYVVSGSIAQRTPVTIGLEKTDAVEIVSGVREGQAILVSSVYGLGDKVKLASPENAPKPDKDAAQEKPGR